MGPPPASERRTGLTFASYQPMGTQVALETAATAAKLGYTSFWTAETVGQEAFATLAAVGATTPALDLGTGVLALQLRTPMLATMGAATLQTLVPDREVHLGVGISSPVVTERWHGAPYGERPVARVREYLTLVSELLDGEAVTFDGDFYRCTRARLGVRLERRPRLLIGALNQTMLRLAGELADGVLLNYLPASAVPWCVEQVRRGEDGAGRTPGACRVLAYVHAGVCDREDGIDAARKDLFSYIVVDAYARAFTRAGFGDVVEEVRERHAAGDRDGAVAAVSDAMVDVIDVMGDGAHVAATMASYVAAGVDEPILMPLPWGRDRRAVLDATIEAAIGW